MSVHKSALWRVTSLETISGIPVERIHYVTLKANETKPTPAALDALGFVCFSGTGKTRRRKGLSGEIDKVMEKLKKDLMHPKRKKRDFKIIKAEFLGECWS